jgi:hypothetical protein
VTVTTGAARVVSAVDSFFVESTRHPARKSGKREAGRGKRERQNQTQEMSIGGNGERERMRQYDEAPD